MIQIGTTLVGFHDDRLVALSVFIAISASYAALDLGGRVTAASGWNRSAWLAGGAAAMGLGIWSMHFTGMLAFQLPLPVVYHWPTVLLSLLAAIFGSVVALYVVSRRKMSRVHTFAGSILMGLAIVGMHYTGMASMRVAAACHYNPLLVTLSVLIAVFASLVALIFTFDYGEYFRGTNLSKLLGATVMGLAISSMHYTGMMAARFVTSSIVPDVSHTLNISSLGLIGISMGTLVVQGVAILTSSVDRRFATRALELQASERFRQIGDNLQVVLFLASPDFSELLYVNPTYQKIWGRTVESLYARPKSWMDGVHPEDRGRVDDLVQRMAHGLSEAALECRVVRPDGSTTWVAVRGDPIRDPQGRAYRLVGSAQDITEPKRAEEGLLQARVRIESVLNSVADVHIVFDRQWRYLYVNEAAARAMRRPREQIVGHTLWELFPDIVGTELDRQYHRAMEERVPVDFEFYYPTLKTWWGNRFLPAPEGLAVFATEITDRKRAEEELRRLSGQLLRLQDEERRRIARDLHDSTGQDLVALAATLSLVHDSIPSSGKKLRKLASQCQALAEQCVREVRTLSYLLHPPMLDEAGLEDAILHYADGFTERTGIDVELEVSPRFGRMGPDVEVALFRIVQESLINVQRHSGSPRAKIRINREPEKITLEVIDTGSGISGNQQGRDVGLSTRLGVGIPSMQERMKLIGGRLEIDSGSSGTTVRVTMPADDQTCETTSYPGGA
jgi:PAS domain S-box-containing protein